MRAMRWLLWLPLGFAISCGDDDSDRPADTGQACSSAAQCYPDLGDEPLHGGDAECLDRVEGGYCTHPCETDADCCAVPGECENEYAQVCAPFESTGGRYCFLSCEARDLDAAGVDDGDLYCERFASSDFHCRSTGGGSENRKVCVP